MTYPDHDKRKGLEHVGDLVDGVVSSLGGREGLGSAALLFAEWPNVSGPDWEGAKPVRLDRGVLSVGVPDGITATKLRYEVGPLLRRIEDRLGQGVVTTVKLKVTRPGRRR